MSMMMLKKLPTGLTRQLAGLCLRQSLKPAACGISRIRLYSQDTTSQEPKEQKEAVSAESSVPWYLRVNEDATQLNPALTEPIPDTPENSPECLEEIIHYMVRELGFTNVSFIDLRNRSPVTVFGPDAILVLATGNTDRHIGRGTNSLMTYIKQTFKVIPSQEGIQTSGFLKVHQRRLKKKAKKMANSDETFDYALEASRFANNWVVLDTKMNGITIHMLTPEKREELDLEYVWAEDKKALRELRKQQQSELEETFEEAEDYYFEEQSSHESPKSSSPFSSSMGATRQYHTSTRSFSSISASRLAMSNTIHSSSPLDISSIKSPNNAVLDQLEICSFLGDYKKAIDLTRDQRDDEKYTQLILKAHINHLSKIKNTSEASSLTSQSEVVRSFISSFPYYPTPADWRLRLIFIQHAHEINHDRFPLEILEEHLILQQASGFPVEMWDVEFMLNTVVKSSQFNGPSRSLSKVSGLKSKLIFSVFKNCLRPQGTALSLNNVIYVLLYRLWIGEPELTPALAVRDPTPKRNETTGELLVERPLVLNAKSLSLYQYMFESSANITKPFLILSLTAFANDNLWGKFFSLFARISKDKTVDSEILNLMSSLVVKSGHQVAIANLVECVIPDQVMANEELLTPELAGILKTALSCLDPSDSGYSHVRNLIKNCA